ncbi:MAG TPA: Stp1/IreP family PP2C-type Ser/Thr phosphatase [Solirubrobacteraceae bacterium]|nr:Stp1/IreP family PP2C-type Ser/Thr phosphatase [Solirubrobacteraceae bacterium]
MLRAAETIVRTDVGRQRRSNEDSSYAGAPVFVVADGMGGAQAGEVASQMVVEAFAEGLPQDGTPEERLSVVVQKANHEIHARSRSDAASAGMGTTVTAAYLDEDSVALAHVGDSRAYLLRDGELSRLTEDHSLVEELLRGGKLTEEEALEHPQRSVITRALGIEPIVEIDTWTYPLRPGDVVLLCSDGLTSMLSEQQVQQVLLDSADLEQAGDQLIAEANEAGGRDNITVVLFRVEAASGADAGVDQPTIIAAAGSLPTAQPLRAEITPRPVRRARLQGWKPHVPAGFVQPANQERHFGRLGKSVALLTALLVVFCLVGGGGYLASRQLYFLGTNGQGTMVVYRGFPYVLPFGIPMYETFYVSGVPASTIPVDRRKQWLNHAMRDETNAISMINALELGHISK